MKTTHFEAEVHEQPAVLARLLAEERARAERIADRLRAYEPKFAVLAARGTSDNAARYGQYVLGIHNHLVAALATPSLFTQYGASPSLEGALVVGISQSGQSPDIVEVLRAARAQGAVTLAVTNEEESPLASAAELFFPLRAGLERAVAATKTYTAELMALAMLSAALQGKDEAWRQLDAVPSLVARALDLNRGLLPRAQPYRDRTSLVVVSRGYNLSTASEIALKVKETSAIMADGSSSADFLHGPAAVLHPGLPVLAVAPGPRAFPDLEALVERTRAAGAPLLSISNRPEMLDAADVAMPLPADLPEWVSPMVAVVPGQLWALGLCLARGRQPDAPPGLSKVTRTR